MQDKKQHLIDTALRLFYHHGIHAVGINHILSESGVAKKTLYHHFASKEALILATLAQRHRCFMAWLRHQVQDKRGQQGVSALFTALGCWFSGQEQALGPFRGCFFINTHGEFDASHSDILSACRAHKKEVETAIAAMLSAAEQPLAPAIAMLMEGAIVKATLGQPQAATEHALQSALILLDRGQ
tara:strand:+ start:8109 stop:8663 length:555 start_codon:yes stop_codon:yes gene_type:complete